MSIADIPEKILLSDYQMPNFLVKNVELKFELDLINTRVTSILTMKKNPNSSSDICILDGKCLKLISTKLDGRLLQGNEFERTDKTLLLTSVPDEFRLEIVTIIHPSYNTVLEGLYYSDNLLCTQCESQGFRHITYYPDRPDVMAVYTVYVLADKRQWPVILSNGNLQKQGVLDNGQHWFCWHDPHPKPSYLFALVAGDLSCYQDGFITASGNNVILQIYVEHNSHKCNHALNSLKQSMEWDEITYGREYDLNIYMIVAVNNFNMGAMENKGLNIFNSACILATPETSTDKDYFTIQSIIGHEYFHNWSGNRITCRDWFQLSLKEGFTVLREHQFSADLNSHVVQRIDNINELRRIQFAEDAGPMAHPVRPISYIQISNFYTATIYEKGAEVVGMIKTIVGESGFRYGTNLYFTRHDGQAVTIDNFIKAIEDANDIDLNQFKLWYSQAGTPELTVNTYHNIKDHIFELSISQNCPDTPDQLKKHAFMIPLAIGLLDNDGQAIPMQLKGENAIFDGNTRILLLLKSTQIFTFMNVIKKPIISLLRDFSAPVNIRYKRSNEELAFLMANDVDNFNKWDAGQKLFINILINFVNDIKTQIRLVLPAILQDQIGILFDKAKYDPALVAKMLELPNENYLASRNQPADVDAIHVSCKFLKESLATIFKDRFVQIYQNCNIIESYQFNAEDMAKRSLKNICLDYLMATGDPMQMQRCLMQMKRTDNMTDMLAGLSLLVSHPGPECEHALRAFFKQWHHDRQVMDKWLTVQALSTSEDTLMRVKSLIKHPAFSITNPNNVKSLIGQFCLNNPVNFHAKDGSGYIFLVKQILVLDLLNPRVAAKQMLAFNSWRQYDKRRQDLMKNAILFIAEHECLSSDVYEIATKYLA